MPQDHRKCNQLINNCTLIIGNVWWWSSFESLNDVPFPMEFTAIAVTRFCNSHTFHLLVSLPFQPILSSLSHHPPTWSRWAGPSRRWVGVPRYRACTAINEAPEAASCFTSFKVSWMEKKCGMTCHEQHRDNDSFLFAHVMSPIVFLTRYCSYQRNDIIIISVYYITIYILYLSKTDCIGLDHHCSKTLRITW